MFIGRKNKQENMSKFYFIIIRITSPVVLEESAMKYVPSRH